MEQLRRLPYHHVVFFTHNEQSHITPMFALARELSSRGLQITCALPATSYASYCNNNASQMSSNPFQVESVGESTEHSSDDFFLLQKKLEEGLVHLMQRLQPRPVCLIADIVYFTWSQEVADRLGVRLFLFSPFFATTLLVMCHLPELLKEGVLPFQRGTEDTLIDFIPGLMKDFRLADVALDFLGRSAAELEAMKFLQHSKACAGLIMCNTSYALDIEAQALDALVAHGLRIFPLAPMLHMDWSRNTNTLLYRENGECLSWLDKQPTGSVVYASFGSIISLTQEEIQELALGLEACGQPFLWVVRRIEGCSDVMSVLPPGFLERIKDRGRIVSWARQMAVLSHPSVGCFLFHSGSASLLEGVWTGVPMIGGFCKFSDQNTVLKIMTDGWRVALPLRSKAHAALRSSIEAAIKEVMHEQGTSGAAMRGRIKHLKAAMTEAVGPSGVSRRYLDQLVDILHLPAKQEISSE